MTEPPKVILAPGEHDGDWATPEGAVESFELRLHRLLHQVQRHIGWQACLRALRSAKTGGT